LIQHLQYRRKFERLLNRPQQRQALASGEAQTTP